MNLPLIEGPLRKNLREIIIAEAPFEAVGLIYQEQVYPLVNHARNLEAMFEIHLAELRDIVTALGVPLKTVNEDVVLWHSHPGGGIGPSSYDITHRTPLKNHLVLTLVDDDLVATWY